MFHYAKGLEYSVTKAALRFGMPEEKFPIEDAIKKIPQVGVLALGSARNSDLCSFSSLTRTIIISS